MATAQQASDRLNSPESAEALHVMVIDTKQNPANTHMLKDQDVVQIATLRNGANQLEPISLVGDYKTVNSGNAFSSHAKSVYTRGYDKEIGSQSGCGYLPYVNVESAESSSHGIYNEILSRSFHGYPSSNQMHQRSYDPVTMQSPPIRDHNQLYSAAVFPTLDPPYYQQPLPQNHPYITSWTQVPHPSLPVDIDFQVDGKQSGPRAYSPAPLGSSGRGSNFSGTSADLSFLQQGFDDFGVGTQSNWSKSLHGKSPLFQLSSQVPSARPRGSLELFGTDFRMASQQKRPFYGFGSSSFRYRRYPYSQSDRGSGYQSISDSSSGMDDHNWPTPDEARQGGRCNNFACSCTITLDTLSERNRGPRAFRPKGQTMANGPFFSSGKNGTVDDVHIELYNGLDFVTDYKNAKFFIIKSYSEDNVHKSIKYGVWASTPNGNKKLDAAYHEAKEKEEPCPIFLLFSVNASAQFCGVAEMVGPVDFDKSVDYWLQDKWSGQFSVKWHLIKDVPNSLFRHILLENNDNKPVTNSRDTQEVELEQGVEMLNIFKQYETHSSILDDFYFYEERQKAMEERKAKHQTSTVSVPVAVTSEKQSPISLSDDFGKKMSKSFAEALVLNQK